MKRSFNQTFTFFKRLAEYYEFGKIAKQCGKETETATAWAREPESNLNPNGTGKRNPMDCVIRLIGMAHKEDAGLAREMAETFPDYVNLLDGEKTGKHAPVNELIGSSCKEHTDVVVKLLNTESPNWAQVNTEIVQAEIALRKLKLWVKDELIAESERAFGGLND